MSSNTLDGKGLSEATNLSDVTPPFWMDAEAFQQTCSGPNIAITGGLKAEDNTPRRLAVNAGSGAVYVFDPRTEASPMVVVLGVVTPVDGNHALLNGGASREAAHTTGTFKEALSLVGMSRTGEQADLTELVAQVSRSTTQQASRLTH